MDVKGKTPHNPEYKIGLLVQSLFLLALFFFAAQLVGQQRGATAAYAKGEAQGSLRVIVMVQSSVGIVVDKDGQTQVIVANAPDRSDGVLYLREAAVTQAARHSQKQPAPSSEQAAQNKKR